MEPRGCRFFALDLLLRRLGSRVTIILVNRAPANRSNRHFLLNRRQRVGATHPDFVAGLRAVGSAASVVILLRLAGLIEATFMRRGAYDLAALGTSLRAAGAPIFSKSPVERRLSCQDTLRVLEG
jgi:hypothetical protein